MQLDPGMLASVQRIGLDGQFLRDTSEILMREFRDLIDPGDIERIIWFTLRGIDRRFPNRKEAAAYAFVACRNAAWAEAKQTLNQIAIQPLPRNFELEDTRYDAAPGFDLEIEEEAQACKNLILRHPLFGKRAAVEFAKGNTLLQKKMVRMLRDQGYSRTKAYHLFDQLFMQIRVGHLPRNPPN